MTARRALLAAATALAVLLPAAAAPAADVWQPWPLPVPPGGRYETPPGAPGDLSFWAPNRGLLSVGGNTAVPEGLYSFDGAAWHQLSVVCGGAGNARIAWAGPDEFWTISRPSLPRQPSPGLALCHFKDGTVVGSYSTTLEADDPYHPMFAAACSGPADCWFGGVFGQDGLGRRSGAFHLHWDGSRLQTVYGPQGRAVSDLLFDRGRWWESTFLGPSPAEGTSPVTLRDPEPVPRLLHAITADGFADDPFTSSTLPTKTELRALDGDGTTTWAAGGGAPLDGQVAAPPLLARLGASGWEQLPTAGLPTDESLVDIAAVPGTGSAWAALAAPSPTGSTEADAYPTVVHVAADGTLAPQALGADPDPQKGAATRVDCPAPDDCWMVTARGYLYRWTPNGVPAYPVDTDPAFQGTITQRPNESAEQAIPDDPPEDDSGLAAPPVDLYLDTGTSGASAQSCGTLPALVSRVKATVRGKKHLRLVVSFRIARRAKVGMTAKRGGRVVARAKVRTLKPGNRSLTLSVSRRRWPTKLAFVVRDDSGLKPKRKATCSAGSDSNTFVTP